MFKVLVLVAAVAVSAQLTAAMHSHLQFEFEPLSSELIYFVNNIAKTTWKVISEIFFRLRHFSGLFRLSAFPFCIYTDSIELIAFEVQK